MPALSPPTVNCMTAASSAAEKTTQVALHLSSVAFPNIQAVLACSGPTILHHSSHINTSCYKNSLFSFSSLVSICWEFFLLSPLIRLLFLCLQITVCLNKWRITTYKCGLRESSCSTRALFIQYESPPTPCPHYFCARCGMDFLLVLVFSMVRAFLVLLLAG